MSKHSDESGLQQLRKLFPSKGGFHIDPIGNNAGDVWKGMEHVGLVSKDKTTGKWICTHNSTLRDGDPRFVHEDIMDAVIEYVTKYPDVYSPGLINYLKSMRICSCKPRLHLLHVRKG